MDEYAREMMDLKTLVTRVLEKRGVLARIRAELRANVFAAIEEEDRAIENEENPTFALLGACNERAKELHASPTGKLLTALICDYLEWCHLEHTLKVYLPECNLPRGFWKSELKEKLGQKSDSGQGNDGPLLVEILESYLKLQQQNTDSNLTGSFAKLAIRRTSQDTLASDDSQGETVDKNNTNRRSLSASSTGNHLPSGRRGPSPIGQTRHSTIPTRNYDVSTANDRNTIEESAVKVKRTQLTDTDSIETVGDVNENTQSLLGDMVKIHEDASFSKGQDLDMLHSEKISDGSESENKSQHLNMFWRKGTTVTSFDNSFLEGLEEIMEEEDASFEKESYTSA